jgi:hypothetical protein
LQAGTRICERGCLLGSLIKLAAFLGTLLVSYVILSVTLQYIGFLPLLLGLSPGAPNPYSALLDYALVAVCAVLVLTFFTIPVILAVFGRAGAWVKHVAVRSARWLFAAFGAVVLLYLGAGAVSTIEEGLSIGSLFVLLVSGVLLIGLLSGGTLLRGVEGAFFTLAPRLRLPGTSESRAAVELRLTPIRQIREKRDERLAQEEAVKFQRLVMNLASLGGIVAFKLSFRQGRGKILLLARGREGKGRLDQRLLDVARTYLPDAKPALVEFEAEAQAHSSSFMISGPPEPAANPLEPLARFFLENRYEGDYSAVLRARGVNPVSAMLARKEQRRLARGSVEQKTSMSLTGEQTSTSVQDHLVQTQLEEASRRVERASSRLAVKAWVYVTAHGHTEGEAKRIAEAAADDVQPSLSSHRKWRELRVKRLRRPVADLSPRGRPTVLLPSEAVPLVWVPQMAMGNEVAPAVEFELPPALEGEIELGEIVLQSGGSGHVARLWLDDLKKHTFLTGMTGFGKTTTAFNLLLQVYRHGVPFLVIEPVKTEYRSLATCIQGLQVFTIGDEKTAPFRLNIFEPPSGVSVAKHMESLAAAWNAGFPMYQPLPHVVKLVLVETYRSCGWDAMKDLRGRAITLDDFRLAAERVAGKLGYEPPVTMNIEAALRTRITSLGLGGKGALFNTTSSTPLEAILRRPTVIELKSIPDEEKAFVTALILSNMVEYLEAKGASKALRHFTLIEEAHRLLPNISTEKGDPEAADTRRMMVEHFAKMLAEVRAYGEGLAVVEQIPTKIIPDAIKNTATKIAHRVPAADDREVLAGAMNMTREQCDVLTTLQPGEAVVHLERHPLPIRVAAPNPIQELGIVVGGMSDDDVKRLMAEFYAKNPLPRVPQSLLKSRLQEIVDSEWFMAKFLEGFKEMMKTRSPDKILDLVTKSSLALSEDEDEFLTNTLKLLELATAFYLSLSEEDRERFPREVMRYMARSGRSGWRR